MPAIRAYTPFVFSALLLCAVLLLIYPYCQYYIDPDATAYLTIAKRYAMEDYDKAINGYWSPWSCWLTALLIKSGLAPFLSTIIINTIGAVGVLFITQAFFAFCKIERQIQWYISVTLALFLSYAVFKQTFADLWQCVFLLLSLRIMLMENYKARPSLWLLNGIAGALAYFSKAYAFPFFILNTVCCSFVITQAWNKTNRGQWLKISAASIAIMFAFSTPWIYLLHEKYGRWMTSTAGSLNMSWYLVGHPIWKEGIHILVPPIYPDSPYYWEDPYLVNGDTPHFWDGPKLFILQLVKLVYNLLKFVKSMNEISAFFLPVWLLAIGVFVSKRAQLMFGDKMRVIILSFLLFPMGFILINFEARYIWYMLPLSMVIGAWAMQHAFTSFDIQGRLKNIVLFVFAASYLVWPALDMKNMFREGVAEYETAKQLNALGIRGSFTANVVYGTQMPGVARLAYFSGNPYYNMPHTDFSKKQLLDEMRRYRVKYYFHYSPHVEMDDFVLTDEAGRPFKELSQKRLRGLKVFEVN